MSDFDLPSSPTMILQKAVDLGEYEPEYLATFPEGLENHMRQLTQQYAAICNILDFSKKPHLQEALKNIGIQQKKLRADKERLFMEYTKL